MAYRVDLGNYKNPRTKSKPILQKYLALASSEVPNTPKYRETYSFYSQEREEIEAHLTPMEFYLAVATLIGVEAANNRCDTAFCEMRDHQLKS